MRNITVRLLIGLSVLFTFYLLFSFVKLTFDFTKWSEECRMLFALVGGLLSLMAATAPYNTDDFFND